MLIIHTIHILFIFFNFIFFSSSIHIPHRTVLMFCFFSYIQLLMFQSNNHNTTIDGWMVGCLVGWMVGWLVAYLFGWMVKMMMMIEVAVVVMMMIRYISHCNAEIGFIVFGKLTFNNLCCGLFFSLYTIIIIIVVYCAGTTLA